MEYIYKAIFALSAFLALVSFGTIFSKSVYENHDRSERTIIIFLLACITMMMAIEKAA